MSLNKEVLKAKRDALAHWQREFALETDEGAAAVADFLGRAVRVIGRMLEEPTPPEPPEKDMDADRPRADEVRAD